MVPHVSASTRSLWGLAAAIYVGVTAVFIAMLSPELLTHHTAYNHFALQAESWLHGSLALVGRPPEYAGANDFALYGGRWFIVFPPFPAVILLPFVWGAGAATRVPDGLIFACVGGVGPAVVWLTLEKLRRRTAVGSATRSAALALLCAFGTPFFFSAVQGTVWYAAHVVAVALVAIYCYAALGAEKPLIAGIALGLGYLTRAPVVFAAPLFIAEAWRAASAKSEHVYSAGVRRDGIAMRWRVLVRLLTWFTLPLIIAGAISLALNAVRFGDPFEPGYRFLVVRWQSRIEAWGLFHYHYLARNLGVLLASLPWTGGGTGVPFRINGHGLALWFTSPFLLWLACRSRGPVLTRALCASLVAVAMPTIFYQNSGWVQFGYRFANDYIVLAVLMLSLTDLRPRRLFVALAGWSVAVNAFGALSFNRPEWSRYYSIEPTQRIIFEPD